MPVNLVNVGGGGSVGFGNAMNQRRQNRILRELGRAPLSQRNQSDDLLPILALILQLQSQKEGQATRRGELDLAAIAQKGQLGIQQGQLDLQKQMAELQTSQGRFAGNVPQFERFRARGQNVLNRGEEARGRQGTRFAEDILDQRETGERGVLTSSLGARRLFGALDEGPITAKGIGALGTGLDEYMGNFRSDIEKLIMGGAPRSAVDAGIDVGRETLNMFQATSGGAGKDVAGAADLDRRIADMITGLDKFEKVVDFDPRTVQRGMEDITTDADLAQRDALQTRMDVVAGQLFAENSDFAKIANAPFDLDDPRLDFGGLGGGPILEADMAELEAIIREIFGGGQAGGVSSNPLINQFVAQKSAAAGTFATQQAAQETEDAQRAEFREFLESERAARKAATRGKYAQSGGFIEFLKSKKEARIRATRESFVRRSERSQDR